MGNIKILDDSIAGKIAAGEVVERPVSIVKELIENSIDAKSKKVFIKLNEGGISLISVQDDGVGMGKEDVSICLERHATSKINSVQDLFNIHSLGFRGEALASIAAVSHLEIVSRRIDQNHAYLIDSDKNVVEVTANVGTTVTVKDLFYNTPARKKFLRSIENELYIIVDVVSKYSLAYPEIHFRLINDGKELIDSPSTKDNLQNISYIYSRDLTRKLIKVESKNEDLRINGYVSPPQVTKSDKGYQIIFVNKRLVKSKVITDAIYSAYHSMLFTKRHPIFILNIEIKSTDIDVNVHPAKIEIKINNEKKLTNFITDSISKSLSKEDLSPNLERNEFNKKLNYEVSEEKKPYTKQRYGVDYDTQSLLSGAEEKKIEQKILGQINKEYIIAEDKEGLMIIDQHAAEERVNYEMFLRQKRNGSIKSQNLLQSKIITLSPKQKAVLLKFLDKFESNGIKIEEFGENDFIIKSVPVIFGSVADGSFVEDLVDSITRDKNHAEEYVEEKIIRHSCRKSVKAGDNMSIFEMENLVSEIFQCEKPYTCPHGRPTIIRLNYNELEKKFKRV